MGKRRFTPPHPASSAPTKPTASQCPTGLDHFATRRAVDAAYGHASSSCWPHDVHITQCTVCHGWHIKEGQRP